MYIKCVGERNNQRKGERKMSKYRVHFFDKYGDECRSLVVEATSEGVAEDKACDRANDMGWSESFRMGDVELLD